MRVVARLLVLLALGVGALGCRERGDGGPMRSDQGDCSDGEPHLVVGVQAHGDEQGIARFTSDLAPCRGTALPYDEHGTLRSVGGLSDGTDLVGFAGFYGRGGTLVRLDDAIEIARIEDEALHPIAIAALTWNGQRAVAVLWGTGDASDSGERLDMLAEGDLSPIESWEVSYELRRVAAPPSGQPARLAGVIGRGLQEYRADAGATTLATTGELQVSAPSGMRYLRSLDVHGEHVRAASARGVLSWQTGTSPAFLGPVHCQWPDVVGARLPAETAEYVGAVIDPHAPEDTLVLVHGALEGSSETGSHLYRIRRRGECARIWSPSEGRAVAISWSGR